MPSGDTYVLAVDLGTSGPKVALVGADGTLKDYAFRENRVDLLPGGGAEQDPDQWWEAVCAASQAVTSRHPEAARKVTSVCCTAQWSGTVAVDRSGRHLANAIIWLDSRGAAQIRETFGGPVRIEGYNPIRLFKWIRRTGGMPSQSGKDSLAHILYLKSVHPRVYDGAYKFLEPKDYLNFRLTGRFAASFDSITLHWVTDNRDPDKVAYDPDLIRLAGIDGEKLPRLFRAVDILGPVLPEAANRLGISPLAKVVMGSPDVPCAAVGSGAVHDFEAHYYVGTSSWITCHMPFKKTDLFHNMASLPSALPGRYFVANEQETAGACLTFLRDKILFPQDLLDNQPPPEDFFLRLNRAAGSVEAGAKNLIFTPWLYGERTPVEDHTLRAGFFNLTLKTTRAQMARAVMEGVAFNAKWLLGCVERFCKKKLDPIRMIGGGADSELWAQIHADVLNRTIYQVADPIQANFRGAAFLAGLALGQMDLDGIRQQVKIRTKFTPNPKNREIYLRLFPQFLAIYRQNRKIYARLNG